MKKILVVLVSFLLVTGCTLLRPEEQNNIGQNQDGDTNEISYEEKRLNITETGRYVGQIDNNFIKIIIDEKPKTFMLTDESRQSIKEINENQGVEVTYYKNENDQLVIVNLQSLDGNEDEEKTAKGMYVGQIDNFSIEINIDGKPMAFTSYEMEKHLEGLNDGDKVEVKYYENEQGQLIIKNLKKVD